MLDFYFFEAFLNSIADRLNSYALKNHFIIVNLPQFPAAQNHSFWSEVVAIATIITPFATIFVALYTSNKAYKGNLKIADEAYKNNRKIESDKKLQEFKLQLYRNILDYLHNLTLLSPTETTFGNVKLFFREEKSLSMFHTQLSLCSKSEIVDQIAQIAGFYHSIINRAREIDGKFPSIKPKTLFYVIKEKKFEGRLKDSVNALTAEMRKDLGF